MNGPRKTRVAALISGRGTNMLALAEAAQTASYPAEIALVLSDQPDAPGLARAEALGIATAVVPSRDFRGDKPGFEAAIQAALATAGTDLVCLAGFMRVLTPAFVERWRDKLLNIHPSLLPALPGLDTHARAIEAGVKIHGATVHLVRAAVDDGPILAQAALAVRPNDTPESLADRVLALEHRLYPAALARFIRDERVAAPEATLQNPPA